MEPPCKGIAEIQVAGEGEQGTLLDLQKDCRHIRVDFSNYAMWLGVGWDH